MATKSQTRKKSNKKPKEWSTPKRIAFVVIGGSLLVILLGIIVPVISSSISLSMVAGKVTAARSENIPVYDGAREERITALKQSGLIMSETPDFSSKVDACYLAHNDSGWIAQSHYQECYAMYIDLFRVDMDFASAQATLEKAGKSDPTLSKFTFYVPSSCTDTSFTPLPDRSNLEFIQASEASATTSCVLPEQNYSDRVVLYAHNDKDHTAQMIRSFDVSKVSPTENYIYLSSDDAYFKEELGCKSFGLFCEQPINAPVMGELL